MHQQPRQGHQQGVVMQPMGAMDMSMGMGGQQQPLEWMKRPEARAGIPPGLEYLTQIDQLLVQQQMELMEILTNVQCENKYLIKNSVGQQIYFAQEESESACQRQCCGSNRGFVMHVTDNIGQEVIRITRPFKCCSGCTCFACSDCCAMEIEVESPVGETAGYVKQACSCMTPKYNILDSQRQNILQITGPTCICQGPCCTKDIEFVISSEEGVPEVGKISKQYGGYMKEMFTQADNFGVTFPKDLDVRCKAVMIAAVFLIDFMYFEQPKNQGHHHHRRY